MELAIHSSYFLRNNPSSSLPHSLRFSISNRSRRRIALLTVRAEDEKGVVGQQSNEAASVSVSTPSTKSSTERGAGFGSSSSSSSSSQKGKNKRNRERATVIRRSPIDKPTLFNPSQGDDDSQLQQQSANESAFLLSWLVLGFIILVEGIALAASGFLPAEWDKFFVKYLYPSFTPTVFLFVGGTVTYGVLKYLQSEQKKS